MTTTTITEHLLQKPGKPSEIGLESNNHEILLQQHDQQIERLNASQSRFEALDPFEPSFLAELDELIAAHRGYEQAYAALVKHYDHMLNILVERKLAIDRSKS